MSLNLQDTYPPFSVVIAVYSGDKADWFEAALNSIIQAQTVKPSEISLVVDGPIQDSIDEVIKKYQCICDNLGIVFKTVYLKCNQGQGHAFRISLANCSHEIVAKMDSDDISLPNRFEEQLKYIVLNDVDIVGGNIAEFTDDPKSIVAYRNVPEKEDDIIEYMKRRCPFNHTTVMFKKSAVESAGGYLDWFLDEDYYLWIRMYLQKCRMSNTGTILAYVRINDDMYKRRGGIKYFKSEIKLQNFMLDKGIISLPTYIMNCTKRAIIQLLLPNKIRGLIFKKFARD